MQIGGLHLRAIALRLPLLAMVACTTVSAQELNTSKLRIAPDLRQVEPLPSVTPITPAPPTQPHAIPPSAGKATELPSLPADFRPWWQPFVLQPLGDPLGVKPMDLDGVVLETLTHSSRVRVLSDMPVIRRAAVMEAQARFDPRTFIQEKYVDTSDPVGNTLTTGGAPRFNDQNWNFSAGVRRVTPTGAQFEASQKLGYEDNNSIFFVPTQQGTARMSLSYTQPLMNGAGCAYNTSLIVLAEIDVNIAQDQLSRDLQAMLVDVHRTYWELYLDRAALLQRRKLYQDATGILGELNHRRGIDVLGSQLVRAKAAVATREAATIRYAAAVRNSEARLRNLINDPMMAGQPLREIIPVQEPNLGYINVNLEESLVTALHSRPEIDQATREIRAACVRAEVSKNEMMPVLNLILGTYVSGLQGDIGIVPAFGDQFSAGRPSYSAGLLFELPYRNRAAKARYQQRRVELRQITNQMQAVIMNVRAEVEISVRDVSTAYREMVSKSQAIRADEAEIGYLVERWRLLPGDQQVAGVVLDDVLNAQERLADAELDFTRAQVAYNVALINLKRVTGTLLDFEAVAQIDACQDGLPTLLMSKPAKTGEPIATPPPTIGEPTGKSFPESEARRVRPGMPAPSGTLRR